MDPDATYREKAGKEHRGYSANIEETVGRNGSVVTGYHSRRTTSATAPCSRSRKAQYLLLMALMAEATTVILQHPQIENLSPQT